MENLSNENLYDIIKGKHSMPEVMWMLGCTKKTIDDTISELKKVDSNFSFGYFGMAISLSSICYRELVKRGELSADKIFSPNSMRTERRNEFPLNNYEGDVGFKGEEVWRCTKRGNEDAEWQKCF